MGRYLLPMSSAPSAVRGVRSRGMNTRSLFKLGGAPHPPGPPRLYRLAFGLGLLIALGSFAAGLAHVAVSERRLPGIELDPLLRARDALARGDKATAVSEYRGLAAVTPQNFERVLEAAEGLVRAGDAAGGAELLRQAWTIRPGHPRLQTAFGWSLFWTKRYDEAAARFEQALRADPHDLRAHAGLAEVRIEQQRYPEAEAALLRARDLDPSNASVHNSLGITYALTGRPQRAVEEFGVAARLSPTPDILANLERARGETAGRQP
jgi:tetratricopeptide (TPR) repeat protein